MRGHGTTHPTWAVCTTFESPLSFAARNQKWRPCFFIPSSAGLSAACAQGTTALQENVHARLHSYAHVLWLKIEDWKYSPIGQMVICTRTGLAMHKHSLLVHTSHQT
jgi:hypothetical protein